MLPFAYDRLTAIADLPKGQGGPATDAPVQFVAGGTTILDLMRLGVMGPERLVDVTRLDPDRHRAIAADARGLRFGFLTRMADAADHPAVRRDYPVLAQSLELAASPQIRNMATLAGNVLQRTRCSYFREPSWSACNKRNPGSGCAALDGVNRQHAVLGTSDDCIATYAGDFAQALVALDASVETVLRGRTRTLPFAELHRLPGRTPNVETVLAPGELITAILVPAGPHTRRSRYLKVRDRQSYAFALASAAVALHLDGSNVAEARIGLGGVATVPWRAREAESFLRGKTIDEATAARAGEIALADARAHRGNRFKLALGQRTLARALLETAAMEV